MKDKDVLKQYPSAGFLKTSSTHKPNLSLQQKSALIRKGNEFFNSGEIAKAKRIFLTTGYSDGITRLGDHHYQNNDMIESLRMYWIAPDQHKISVLTERIAHIIKSMLNEKEGKV
jgi:hypothetical protein